MRCRCCRACCVDHKSPVLSPLRAELLRSMMNCELPSTVVIMSVGNIFVSVHDTVQTIGDTAVQASKVKGSWSMSKGHEVEKGSVARAEL